MPKKNISLPNDSVKSSSILLVVVFTSLFYISAAMLIYFTTKYKADYVPHYNCNAPMGEFALEPSTFSSNVINTCGSDGKSACVKRVNNLQEAVDYCNLNSLICNRMMYNQESRTVSIISLKGKKSNSNKHDIYTRQLGVTYNRGTPNTTQNKLAPNNTKNNISSNNTVGGY